MLPVVTNIPGQARMVDVIRRGLRTADRVAISVSFLKCSGLGLIIDDLADFCQRGGRGRLLTSTYLGITQPEALDALLPLDGINTRLHLANLAGNDGGLSSTGFHTKFYVFRNQGAECWVGSSNLTKGGLASNLEANMCRLDDVAARALEEVFDQLWTRDDVVPVSPATNQAYSRWRAASSPPAAPPLHSSHFTVPTSLPPAPTPNRAQVEALDRLRELRLSGERRAAVIAAPGVGKTFLAAFDAAAMNARSALFLSHRLEHLSQACETFLKVFRDTRTYGNVYEGQANATADFVFATVQSAHGNATLRARAFDYVVVDEFHHADAPSYVALLDSLSCKFLLGLTATPERQDGHDVLRLCDFNVAYEVRLVEAVNRRWLLPFHYFGLSDDTVDYSLIPWRSGRFDITALENALMLEARVDEILRHAHERGFDGRKRCTVGFCAGVRHAHYMAESFQRRGLGAAAVTGETGLQDRQAVYRRFADPHDPLQWLLVSDVLNEGVDIPCINSILFLRPTESPTLFIQQLGRGLRLTEDCEVLTVLDFVGHHRSAWLALDCLHDADAGETPASITELNFTPPADCEVVLDRRTAEILAKIRRQEQSTRTRCLDAYRRLKEDAPRPYPIDLWGRNDAPEFSAFRIIGTWIDVRQAVGDALDWEAALAPESPAFRLLRALEKDWQQQRVYSYALTWGLCIHPTLPPGDAYALFFERFPRWKAEYKPLDETKAWESVAKKLGDLLVGQRIVPEAFRGIPADHLATEVEGRLRLTLEKDFRLRHGGVLRSPGQLVLHRRYDRPEVINHFGVQYDPARHNFGIIDFDEHLVIITKLNTSTALESFQYKNHFLDRRTFSWQSQNKMRRDNAEGRRIIDHRARGVTIHLFVQTESHEKAYYCGPVSVVPDSAQGDGPITMSLALDHELSPAIASELRVEPLATPREDKPRPPLPTLIPCDDDRVRRDAFKALLPVYTLKAAAGYFGQGEAVEPMGWMEVPGRLDKDMFIAQAVGRSMEPRIHDGDWLVFRANPKGTRNGKIVLAQYRGPADPETGGAYTVKVYSSSKRPTTDGSWRHQELMLSPTNPQFGPIRIPEGDAAEFRIVGEMVSLVEVRDV